MNRRQEYMKFIQDQRDTVERQAVRKYEVQDCNVGYFGK